MSESAVLDPAALEELKELEKDDPGVTRDLIGLFLTTAAQRFLEMREAILKGDMKALQFSAHAFKPSCGTFGATRMVELCKKLEVEAACAVLISETRASEYLAELEVEFACVKPALEALRDGRSCR